MSLTWSNALRSFLNREQDSNLLRWYIPWRILLHNFDEKLLISLTEYHIEGEENLHYHSHNLKCIIWEAEGSTKVGGVMKNLRFRKIKKIVDFFVLESYKYVEVKVE